MKNFIKISICAVILIIAGFAIFAKKPNGVVKRKLILINQFVEHPALNETVRGIIDALADAGFSQEETADIRVESAQANAALAAQISNRFANQLPDVVVCVGTVSAQSMCKYANSGQCKVVFSSITDPVGAGLVEDLSAPRGNITGVSNFVPLEPQLELMRKIQPSMKKLGIIYNFGEANSVSIVEKLDAIVAQFGLALVKQGVAKMADISQAAVNLASRVDAIFISNDNTALSCLPNIFRAGNAANIPVYVSDTDAVPMGALAALGPNQYFIGRQTGEMVAKILGGANVSDLPVEFPNKMELFVNFDAAEILGIEVPEDVI
ncbi:MAG: ABC transporter substrate-binding protein, partial [Puniceicoccales bacterium]|nr:ABC transporter substrate-binding protein [Puniceicoccales bacterium]